MLSRDEIPALFAPKIKLAPQTFFLLLVPVTAYTTVEILSI